MKKYNYIIYQAKVETRFTFLNWEIANKHANWSFDPYRSVWNGTEEAADDMDLVNYLWEVFNINHPFGFRGHSMSVSDIVMFYENSEYPVFYYCDSFGWKNITNAESVQAFVKAYKER